MANLSDAKLFADVNPAEVEAAFGSPAVEAFEAGATLCSVGERNGPILVLESGDAAAFRLDPDGERVQVDAFEALDYFGEEAAFSQEGYRLDVSASKAGALWRLPAADFANFVRSHKTASERIIETYKSRVLEEALALSPLFRPAPRAVRRKLIKHFELGVVKAGQMIIREGDEGDCLFLIKDGEVEVKTHNDAGQEILLATISEGSFVGEVSLVSDTRRTANVVAKTDVRLLRLTREKFDAITKRFPEVRRVAEQYVQRRVEEAIGRMVGEK